MNAELRPVHDLLAAVRRRLAAARRLRALALCASGLAVFVVASFALDRSLDLPLGVRVVHLVISAVVLALWARFALAPLRRRVTDTELAQAVEDAVPSLQDRVASALDFERRLDAPGETESPAMMRAVIRQAASHVASIDAGALVDTRPTRRATRAAAVAGAATVAVALAFPADFLLWMRRGLLLQDVAWPRRTHVTVLDFPEGTKAIARGDDLQVEARVEGEVPREVVLHYEELEYPEGDGEPVVKARDARRMVPVDETEDAASGRFAFAFRAVSASFRFWVTAGDDDDELPQYVVRALVPPRVASITAHVRYPEYSRLPEAIVRQPTFDALEGAHVTLDLQTNMRVAAASLVPDDGPAEQLAVTGQADTLRIELDVTRDLAFHVRLEAESGQPNRDADDRFLIRALRDAPPDVRVLFPLGRIYRTPGGIVPVKAVLRDDYGLATAQVEVVTDNATLLSTQVWPPQAGAAPAAPPESAAEPTPAMRADVYLPVTLGDLRDGDTALVKAGDVLRVQARALDQGRHETVAPDIVIEVLSDEDLLRRLAQRQVALREQLMQLTAHQRRTLEGIRTLRGGIGDGAPVGAQVDRGVELQVEQGRVTGEIQQFCRGVERVFDAYVLNRLGAVVTVDKLLPFYDAALRLPVDDSESVFGPALYGPVLEAKRAGRLFDPEEIGALLDILDLGDEAGGELSPSVYESLRVWSGDSARPESLEEAERRAVELEAKLREIGRRMDRWETLNELIEQARQIRARQRELAAPLDPGLGGDRRSEPGRQR